MTKESEIPEGMMRWVDCDAAYIGEGCRNANPNVAVYDYLKLVKVFMDDGMTEEEAREWIDYNILGATLLNDEGQDVTPIILFPKELSM